MKLKGRVAVVTGASSGIGRSIALLYAKEGAVVYAVARRRDKLIDLEEEVEKFGGKLKPIVADLMDSEGAKNAIEEAYRDAGRLDILVNNAGIMDDFSGVAKTSDEMWEKVMNLNVNTIFYTSKTAVNIFLKEGQGNIINIASIGGLRGGSAGAAYTTSKHAVIGLTENIGALYLKDNIRANAIAPGAIETEVGEGEFMKQINQEDFAKTSSSGEFRIRLAKPEEIANVALFLASDDSSYVNGTVVVADGGATAF